MVTPIEDKRYMWVAPLVIVTLVHCRTLFYLLGLRVTSYNLTVITSQNQRHVRVFQHKLNY